MVVLPAAAAKAQAHIQKDEGHGGDGPEGTPPGPPVAGRTESGEVLGPSNPWTTPVDVTKHGTVGLIQRMIMADYGDKNGGK